MELRHLRYFVAVAEEQSFRRAAERLHMAAPPLNVQIHQLEAEIGVTLLERSGRGIKLTEAGWTFLEHARLTLAEAARGAAAARRAARPASGQLTIGYNMAPEFEIFPAIIPLFRARWPQVRLNFSLLGSTELLDQLRRDEVDVGFVWLPVSVDGLAIAEMKCEPLVAVLHADHPLAGAAEVSIAQLAAEPFILFSAARNPAAFHILEAFFADAGAAMNIAYEVDMFISAINFVAMGLGFTITPAFTRAFQRDGVVFKPLSSPHAEMRFGMVKKVERGGLAEAFFRFTLEAYAAQAGACPEADQAPRPA